MTLLDIDRACEQADAAFDAALKREGFRSLWDWRRGQGSRAIEDAYQAKIAAQDAWHEWHARERAEYVFSPRKNGR